MTGTNKCRILRSAVVILAFASLSIGCGNNADDEKEENQGAETPTGTVGQNSGQSSLPSAPQSVLDLFQDSSAIAPSTLNSGGLDCLQITNAGNFSDAVEPWPAGLKAFLAFELAKFPEFELVNGSVQGIFLAKSSMLSFPDAPANTRVAGIMCGVEGTKKGYVFINYELYVTDRMATGPLEVFQNTTELVHQHVLSEQGDQALYTLIHEVFHAIDAAYFSDNVNGTLTAGRSDVLSMAWTQQGESIDPVAEIFVRTVGFPSHICAPKVFSLAPESPEELAASYRQIAESTSFISPYAQSNPFEDFADTLATWYFKTIHDNGLVRSIYADDLTVTPLSSAELIYKFDTKEILKTSTKHKTKMCAMVDLVFENQGCQLD